MRKFILAAMIAVVAVAFTNTNSADAAFKIRARTNLDGNVTATDQVFVGGVGTVPDLSPVPGAIIASFTFPGVTLLVTVGMSKPISGGPDEAKIDISIDGSFAAANLGRTTITVEVTDTGFGSGFGPAGLGTLTSELGGAGFGDLTSFSFQSWLDNANAEFGIPGSFATPILIAPGTSSNGGTSDTSYSLTNRTIITAPGGSDFSFDNITTFNAIPAPPALLLLASGLPLAMLLRRRTKKAAA